MTTPSSFIAPPRVSVSDSLLTALFIAAVIHAVIILSVSFSSPQPKKFNKSIAITIVNQASKTKPKKAEFFAQSNQLGAGKEQKKPAPVKQVLPSQGQSLQPKRSSGVAKSKPTPAQKVITQKQAKHQITAAEKSTTRVQKARPELSPESLLKQIAQLGAQIRYSQQSAERSRIKFVSSVSTHKYLASQYILDWQRKVEETGNLNYPEVARKKKFTGTLVMDVGIRQDGSIYSIRINRSSGDQAIDDAAKRIVRISAPFAPLPKDLRQELDVLVITRTWQFSDESGMTTRK